jgi:hypothetical protein
MSDLMLLGLLVGLFVASHVLLSHPLRGLLVARLGEKRFAVVYSLVALASFCSAVQLWRETPKERLWDTPAGAYIPALAAMLEKDPNRRARAVDARRLLLDVLRGGDEASGSTRSGAPAPAAPRHRPRRRCSPPPRPPHSPLPLSPGLAHAADLPSGRLRRF